MIRDTHGPIARSSVRAPRAAATLASSGHWRAPRDARRRARARCPSSSSAARARSSARSPFVGNGPGTLLPSRFLGLCGAPPLGPRVAASMARGRARAAMGLVLLWLGLVLAWLLFTTTLDPSEVLAGLAAAAFGVVATVVVRRQRL